MDQQERPRWEYVTVNQHRTIAERVPCHCCRRLYLTTSAEYPQHCPNCRWHRCRSGQPRCGRLPHRGNDPK